MTKRKAIAKLTAWSVLALVALAVVVLAVPQVREAIDQRLDPDRWALRRYLSASGEADLRQAYASRSYRPVWFKDQRPLPEATQIIARMNASAADGLNPSAYRLRIREGSLTQLATASAADRAKFDVALTASFARFAEDLHRPVIGVELEFTDPALRPFRPTQRDAIQTVTSARFLRTAVVNATRMNPFYYEYRNALGQALTSASDPAAQLKLRVNLERMRALPIDLGDRFVFVDITDEKLWVYDHGIAVDSMKVIVGAPTDPTPALAGLVRYAVFNPYWNIPPDLAKRHFVSLIAPDPAGVMARLHIDAWSDFSETARRLEPSEVNWAAAEMGRTNVWLRQRPGSFNAMGAAKFMFPNKFGVYLHDTPNRDLFVADARALSAGCVRVEDYRRLSRWLFRGHYSDTRAADLKLNLPEPVPVYLSYLTAVPVRTGVEMRDDPYGKDAAVLAGLRRRESSGRQTVAER